MKAGRKIAVGKVVYSETYRAPGMKVRPWCLPALPSATGFAVTEAYVLKAGVVERDGERLEFQDVRVYLREAEGPKP